MLVREVMTRNPVFVSPETSLRDAAKTMARRNVGTVLVGSPTRAIGILTDRDLTVRGVAADHDLDKTPVKELLDHPPLTCWEGATVEEAVEIMEEGKIRRILVVDRDNQPSGILSVDDLAVRGHDERLVARALHRIAEDTAVMPR